MKNKPHHQNPPFEALSRAARVLLILVPISLGPGAWALPTPPEDNVLQRPEGRAGDLISEMRTIPIEDGRTHEVEAGRLLVSENRSSPNGDLISLPYYRNPLDGHKARGSDLPPRWRPRVVLDRPLPEPGELR